MHISLTSRLERMVKEKVASGDYNNASEVIREALRLMGERDEIRRRKLEALREAIVAGEASGIVEDFSMGRLMEELDEEAERERQPRG
ncbi:MAG: type II toxin-antitoxin system ParD family antitoxin [bacterium]